MFVLVSSHRYQKHVYQTMNIRERNRDICTTCKKEKRNRTNERDKQSQGNESETALPKKRPHAQTLVLPISFPHSQKNQQESRPKKLETRRQTTFIASNTQHVPRSPAYMSHARHTRNDVRLRWKTMYRYMWRSTWINRQPCSLSLLQRRREMILRKRHIHGLWVR